MFRKKKKINSQITSTQISYIYETTVYCVSFLFINQWFETLKEAEDYRTYLYETFFFDFKHLNFLQKDIITIKEYTIRNF